MFALGLCAGTIRGIKDAAIRRQQAVGRRGAGVARRESRTRATKVSGVFSRRCAGGVRSRARLTAGPSRSTERVEGGPARPCHSVGRSGWLVWRAGGLQCSDRYRQAAGPLDWVVGSIRGRPGPAESGADATGQHQAVDVGVVFERPGLGVQDGHHANQPADVVGISAASLSSAAAAAFMRMPYSGFWRRRTMRRHCSGSVKTTWKFPC